MVNARGKSIDNTHLSIDVAEERVLIHRDYIAHVLRWTFVARELGRSLRYKTARVLDVGCGVDLPLAKMLYSNRYIVDEYIGVDYNARHKLKTNMFEGGKFPFTTYGGMDFASNKITLGNAIDDTHYLKKGEICLRVDDGDYEVDHRLPNVFTAFEMLEHIEPSHSRRVMWKIWTLMNANDVHYVMPSVAYISTPCYDEQVGAAGNHVNEIKREALGAMLEDLGFSIDQNFGTFASQRDYRDNMLSQHPEWTDLYRGLHAYYDSNLLANIFAPLFPQYSRNNLWVLTIAKQGYKRKFPPLEVVPRPWTSSEHWEELKSISFYKE